MKDTPNSLEPYVGDESFLFVSYSREDSQRLKPLLADLRRAGVRIWWDRGLVAGQSYADEIDRQLRKSAGLVVFISANSIARKSENWVHQETKRASELKKELIPVRLDSSKLPLDWGVLVDHVQMLPADSKDALAQATVALRRRGQELGCLENHAIGVQSMQPNRSGFSVQHFVITLLLVVVAILVTVIIVRPDGSQASTSRPTFTNEPTTASGARPSFEYSPATPPSRPASRSSSVAPEVPPEYMRSIQDESRTWTWSKQSSASSNSLTLHWEECPGIEKMKPSNRESETGTISSIASRYGMPARCCRFCYEIESNRRKASGAASGTPGATPSEPPAP
jgi:hypothetical protein